MLLRIPVLVSKPPTTATFPFGNRDAVWLKRVVESAPVEVQTPVEGLKISALVRATAFPFEVLLGLVTPPATRTIPLVSKDEVWFMRAVASGPVKDQRPVVGL